MTPPTVALRVLGAELAVCRLDPGTPIPDPGDAELWALTRTAEETSVVCALEHAPAGAKVEGGWLGYAVAGPLDFGLTGILAAIAAPLAEAGVPIFAISTYDTDYVLVKRADDDRARAALTQAGHRVIDA
ncbi:MAG TPA: ACT domain-containing protein [Actinophytocola sp.]|nr:ACT domain-containing protein [Actinophytocola sp.]